MMFSTPAKVSTTGLFNAGHCIGVLLLWLLINLVLLAPLWQTPGQSGVLASSRVQALGQVDWRALGNEQVQPTWQVASLPHRHRYSADVEAIEYRTSFTVSPDEPADQSWGVCVPHWAWTADVWLNERIVHSASTGIERSTDWMRPHFIALPGVLNAGKYQLALKLQPVVGLTAYLSEIVVASSSAAEALCNQTASRTQVGGNLSAVISALGLAAILLAWRTQSRSALWFCVVAATVEINHLILTHSLSPVADERWIMSLLILNAAVQIPLYFFVATSARLRSTWVDRVVPPLVAMEMLAVLLIPPAWWATWAMGTGVLWWLLGMWLVWSLLSNRPSTSNLAKHLLAVSVLLSMGASAWDVATVFYGFQSDVLLIPAAGIVFTVTFLVSAMLEMIILYKNGQTAQAELAHQLEIEQSELVQSFELLRRGQAMEAQMQERARIMRELHDGLGSQLVAASALLSNVQPGNRALADLIDRCLHELRSTVDSLGVDFHDMGELLGSFRDRIEPVLDAQGIDLDWQVQPMPATAGLNASERLHVLRIVQEAFTNILKHSGANRVTLRAENESAGLSVISIIDNGSGLGPDSLVQPGRGLSNMRARALLLNAQLTLANTGGGFRVCLTLDTAAPSNVIEFPGPTERQRNA
jgi:signal transduction histidine kinase